MSMRKTKFDWAVLDAVLQCGATKVQAASIMDCSDETIERNIENEHGMTFTEYREKKLSATRLKLIQTALSRASSGKSDTMLIFCLKNMCGWKNEPDEELEKVKKEMAELLEQLKTMQGKAS